MLCVKDSVVDVISELIKNTKHRVERSATIVSNQSLDVLTYRYLRSYLLDAAGELEEHSAPHVIETKSMTSIAECLTRETCLHDVDVVGVWFISYICDVTADYVACFRR